ncbi:hypothetical protein MHM95_09450 [Pseudoalteromonas sp. CnMc7-15]|uniref:hypothetical protein n=1 Tax=unclassified Pseudoalteromonas TaxID=194690 RepID=UPI001EF4F1B5|nr:hypothetical protein [Pseudoalteromonas sp. CnMc7-15]MCG7566515.1 hypothetical protein [Pseudoalteromonas sp. CnMc7-15]
MKAQLNQYKHYLIVIAALLVATYVSDPLWQYHQQLAQEAQLSERRANKIAALLDNREQLEQQLESAKAARQQLLPYVYHGKPLSEVKLDVQKSVQAVLKASQCTLETLNWEEPNEVTPRLKQLRFTVNLKGAPLCLVAMTRGIETLMPIVRYQGYSYGGNNWQGKPNERVNSEARLSTWYFEEAL